MPACRPPIPPSATAAPARPRRAATPSAAASARRAAAATVSALAMSALTASLSLPRAEAAERPPEARPPVPTTFGERARASEGPAGDAAALAADAALAAGGVVAGATPLLDTLPRKAIGDAAGLYGGYHEETWVADLGVLLRGDLDRDGDGFFAGFELTLDVDTESSRRDVYAILELSDGGGYVVLRHETAAFEIHGYSSADRYRVEIELLDDYPADYLDLDIEVRDAFDGRLLDRVTAREFRSLSALPLEDERGSVVDDYPYGPDVTHRGEGYVAGYAAASGPLAALALLALALWRRASRSPLRRDATPAGRAP